MTRRSRKNAAIVASVSGVWAIIFLGYSLTGPSLYNSPDETANFYFSQRIAEGNSLSVAREYHPSAQHFIHPRSTTVINGRMVPGSFIGFPVLLGTIGKVFGVVGMKSIVPLASAFSIFVLYLVFRELFSEKLAFIAALFVPFMPAFWYYASRPMFHNSIFTSLLVFGAYCLIQMLNKKSLWFSVAAAACIGAALWVRTSEALWVLPLLGSIFITYRKMLSLRTRISFLLVGCLAVAGLLVLNKNIFGGFFSLAYTPALTTLQNSSDSPGLLSFLLSLFFPFGFDLRSAFWNFVRYIAALAPFLFFLGCVGLGASIKNVWKQKSVTRRLVVGAVMIIAMAYLIVYYGSWQLSEYEDAYKIILGSSYLRYWLPVYLAGAPLVAFGFLRILDGISSVKSRRAFSVLFIAIIICSTTRIVYQDKLHGLLIVRGNLDKSMMEQRELLKNVEMDAVIISGHADKLFFPQREVIVELPEFPSAAYSSLQAALNGISVYYFVEESIPNDVVSWNASVLQHANASMISHASTATSVLYKVQL